MSECKQVYDSDFWEQDRSDQDSESPDSSSKKKSSTRGLNFWQTRKSSFKSKILTYLSKLTVNIAEELVSELEFFGLCWEQKIIMAEKKYTVHVLKNNKIILCYKFVEWQYRYKNANNTMEKALWFREGECHIKSKEPVKKAFLSSGVVYQGPQCTWNNAD